MKSARSNHISIASSVVIASEARQSSATVGLDCFALLAMTVSGIFVMTLNAVAQDSAA